MAAIKTQWTRLIRFVAAETGLVHLGEPVERHLDVGLAAYEKKPIKAYEVLGSALDPAAQVTKNVLTVKELLAPLEREEVKIVRCLGLNYADHAAEAKLAKPAAPVLFYKPATSIVGPLAPISVPKCAQPVDKHLSDYEVELVVVIGKAAKNVSEADALDYVLAYTGGNDVSFRTHQFATSQWGFSKSFDDSNPIGPCLVSAAKFPDPQTVGLRTVLNGSIMQNGTTSDQIFTVRQTIAYLSQSTTLLPGSIIMTGTPAGVGFVKSPPVVLKDGDDCRVWVGAGIGTCINKVVEEGKGGLKARL
ncbi:fumarylacetoacetate hydrolase [Heliocybe sulcata]|uniref:Fumarylacetoacetate hydrolase n=1 Tax=Heliocybe sulcata TaxID=5364 RepID=A0A5C3NFY8_9AGAM|nr:fumarylacetoacetate hydrolase [Heliocybe sulcata]